MLACRSIQRESYLLPCIKLKYKWIKDLNIKPDTLNLLEEKVGNIFENISTVLNRTPTTQVLRLKIHKWNLMKLKILFKAKDTKWQLPEWEKIFTNYTSKICKELKKLDINKLINLI